MKSAIPVQLPASKSMGARFLVATYFARTLPADPYFDDNDDLLVLQQALLALYSDEQPIDYGNTPVDVHASGTAFRFVAAVCASSPGADFVITGTPRLCSRPMAPLLDILTQAGASVTPLGPGATGPYRIAGRRLAGGEFSIAGNISSQFISALMLVAPSWHHGMKLHFTTPLVSRPYLEMTASLMQEFGIDVKLTDSFVHVRPGQYKVPVDYRVEADWSSASFFYEACALGAGNLLLENLVSPAVSRQGDSRCAEIFARLGVESRFTPQGAEISQEGQPVEMLEYDFTDCPDLVLPVAVASLCRGIPFRFTGVANLRLKESDRLEALRKESLKLGYVVNIGDDTAEWLGERTEAEASPVIETYDDHRVAMSFAVAALSVGTITISRPQVVEKSFANFWQQLSSLPVSISPRRQEELYTIKKNY